MTYQKGSERIPENWFRFHGEYTLAKLNVDLVSWVRKHPRLASIGGNLGEVNSFSGVDWADLTGGAINAATLLEGNNLVCFSLEIVKAFAPNSLSTLFSSLTKPLKLINDAVLDPLLDLGCPAFDELRAGGKDVLGTLLNKYPGAKKSGFAF